MDEAGSVRKMLSKVNKLTGEITPEPLSVGSSG
jgi:hypothetical protein